MPPALKPWPPTVFRRFSRGLRTSMATAEVVTDAGPAYLKAIGNPEGEHALAADLLGTQLAAWFDLPTFEFGVLLLTPSDQVPLTHNQVAQPGPAFVTRKMDGHSWGGASEELTELSNPGDVGKLVVLDTWLRNADRFPPRGAVVGDPARRDPNLDNVFLAAGNRGQAPRLIAMDFSHAFTCGRPITSRLSAIDVVRERAVYGLFDEFRPYLTQGVVDDAQGKLSSIDPAAVAKMVAAIPPEWQVSDLARLALETFTCDRARWLGDNLRDLVRECA